MAGEPVSGREMRDFLADIVTGEAGEGGDLSCQIIQELVDGDTLDRFFVPGVDVIEEVSQHPQGLDTALLLLDVSHSDRDLLRTDMVWQDVDCHFEVDL